MENLKARRTGGFVFRDREPKVVGETVDAVEVTVDYDIGGTSMFGGQQTKRGLYIHITPKGIEKTEYGESWKLSLLGDMRRSGRKVFAMPLARKNDKKLMALAEKMDPHVKDWAETFRNDPETAFGKVLAFVHSL